MTQNKFLDRLAVVVEAFQANARAELDAKWNEWPLDLSRTHVHEVIGGLLARQVSLAGNIASAPSIWNPHVAPVLLRAMADVVITAAWILEEPDERAKRYIYYGLGQMKLEMERRKAELDPLNPDPSALRMIEVSEGWIEQQRWPFLVEVNLGSWTDVSVRDMALKTGLIDFYNYVYQEFSAATHSTWHHVGRLNVDQCQSPLHRYHRVPVDPPISPDITFLLLAGKYLAKLFEIFDAKCQVTTDTSSAFEVLRSDVDALADDDDPDAGEPEA